MPEFIKNCQTDSGVVKEFREDHYIATKIAHDLSDDLVKTAKKLPKVEKAVGTNLLGIGVLKML